MAPWFEHTVLTCSHRANRSLLRFLSLLRSPCHYCCCGYQTWSFVSILVLYKNPINIFIALSATANILYCNISSQQYINCNIRHHQYIVLQCLRSTIYLLQYLRPSIYCIAIISAINILMFFTMPPFSITFAQLKMK
jgi:hypothetical protein